MRILQPVKGGSLNNRNLLFRPIACPRNGLRLYTYGCSVGDYVCGLLLHILALVLPHSPAIKFTTNSTRFNFGGYQLVKQDFDVPREPLPDTEKSTPARLDPEPSTISFADSVRKTLSIVSRIAVRKPQQCVQTPSETLSSCETILPITDGTDPITTINSPKEAIGIIVSIPVPSIAENTAPTLTHRLWMIIRPFITPPSIALVLSLIIANVPILKALFMENPDIHMPQAPDQRPPLDFLMEIAVFAGPTVPVIGMLLLGAALSRLSMSGLPKGFWKAAVMMAGLKLVVGEFLFFSLFLFHPRALSELSLLLRFYASLPWSGVAETGLRKM